MISLLLLLSCGTSDRMVIAADPTLLPLLEDFIAPIDFDLVVQEKLPGGGFRVEVLDDLDCGECFQLDGEGTSFVVHGGGTLGVQYGLAALLEELGFRFYHPFQSHVPEGLFPLTNLDDAVQTPDVARRGLHLHTLHPIEGLFDFWEPSDDGLARAELVIDWVIKNRGNHLQWVAVQDIIDDETTHAAWLAHTRAIEAKAHERGLTTGLGIQLFGGANLQQAFDLGAEEGPEVIVERLALITDELDFDVLNLSFGEFSGEEPETFVTALTEAGELIHAAEPQAELTTVLHVGNYDDLRVEYQGEELLYYFLVDYADTKLTPWVHSVMYYNLFDDAGGAYLHDEFDEHRDYLLDRLESGEPVGYFPESAYWVAFDINVPTYLPLYVTSRWTDLHELAQRTEAAGVAGLDDHVLFSSGWEWGYWQNDYATLRACWRTGESWRDLYREMFTPYDPAVAEAAIATAEAQYAGLIEQRLAAYLAGREAIIDFGDDMGILSQPDRPSFEELAEASEAELLAFETDVLEPLTTLEQQLLAALAKVEPLQSEDPFVLELQDGIEVTALRTRFARQVFGAAVAHARGATPDLDAPSATLASAAEVVARRHAALHDGPRLVDADEPNPTIYNFGYLARADELCFWERELVQLENLVDGADSVVPGCAL